MIHIGASALTGGMLMLRLTAATLVVLAVYYVAFRILSWLGLGKR